MQQLTFKEQVAKEARMQNTVGPPQIPNTCSFKQVGSRAATLRFIQIGANSFGWKTGPNPL